MRKRPELAKPQVSDKTLAVIQQARACYNKPAPSPKPQATPARSATPPPAAEANLDVPAPPPATPAQPNQVTPMSVQTSASTPLKSPEVKRRKSDSSLSASEVPSLPSFKTTVETTTNPRHSDSATTLSLTEYYLNKMKLSGQILPCLLNAVALVDINIRIPHKHTQY